MAAVVFNEESGEAFSINFGIFQSNQRVDQNNWRINNSIKKHVFLGAFLSRIRGGVGGFLVVRKIEM